VTGFDCEPCGDPIPPGEEITLTAGPADGRTTTHVLCGPCSNVRVRHGGQRWDDAVTNGTGTPVNFNKCGKYEGANVLMYAHPNALPYAYVGWYADEHLIVVRGRT
jgi:hypothetical protein